jgi:uncharacterized protein YqeY
VNQRLSPAEQADVIAASDEYWGEAICAVVVPRAGHSPAPEDQPRSLTNIPLRLGGHGRRVSRMSLRIRMRQALPEAMRARDKVAVSALRATLGALDNAEAVPVGDAGFRGVAIEQSPAGAGAAEAARRELTEGDVSDIVRAEIAERLAAAAQLTAPAHADRVARLRAEAAVLLRFLDGPGIA